MPKYSEGDIVYYSRVPGVEFRVTFINASGTSYDVSALELGDDDESISAEYVPESLLSKLYPGVGEEVETRAQLDTMPEGSLVEWPTDETGVLVKFEGEWHVTGGDMPFRSNVMVHSGLRVVRIGR